MILPARRATKRKVRGLQDLIRHTNLHAAVIVEVGSHIGESAAVFAASGRFTRITCVDPWRTYPAAETVFDQVAKAHPSIRKLKAASVFAASQFEAGSLDMVYIDADHSLPAVREDILAWLPAVRAGGWLCGHDYAWQWPGVLQAVYEIVGPPERVFRDTSWAVKVTPHVRRKAAGWEAELG